MTSPSARSARECPVCGARNSGLSLFCAECGSVLNGSAETRIPEPGSVSDSQQTQAFIPTTRDTTRDTTRGALTGDDERWRATRATALPARGTGSSAWSQEGSPDAAPQTVVFTSDRDGRMRGFILGVVAMALIAVLLGLYVWVGVLGESARDAIGGWFDIVGGSGG